MTKTECLNIIQDNDRYYQMTKSLEPFLTNLDVITNDDFPDSIFFAQNGRVLFEYITKENSDGTHQLYVNFNLIWSKFANDFGCKSDEIKSLIKRHVERGIKTRPISPASHSILIARRWRALKPYVQLSQHINIAEVLSN